MPAGPAEACVCARAFPTQWRAFWTAVAAAATKKALIPPMMSASVRRTGRTTCTGRCSPLRRYCLRSPDQCRRAGMADAADHAGGAVRGRRRHRRQRAHPGAAHGRTARPDDRGRERRRGGRHGRRPARRQGGARRLHLPDRQFRHARLQPGALQEAALQCRDRFPAGRPGVGIARASCLPARICR